MNKNIIVFIIIIIIIIGGAYFLWQNNSKASEAALSQSQNSQSQNNASASYDIQGMKVEILKEGTGAAAKAGDKVTVNYTGTLSDGTKFDSSLNPGRTPFQFTLGQNQVIQGWELGVSGMKVGEKRRLTIPPELGYGAQGANGVIPPNATLTFEIDLLGIN
jgi:FKBP-type peptidyl-prolyl cis-trans isomerase